MVLLDVVDRLLVRDHREVVAVQLQYLVVHPQAGPARRAVLVDVRHVDSAVGVAVRAAPEVLVDAAADLEPAFPDLQPIGADLGLLCQRDGNLWGKRNVR